MTARYTPVGWNRNKLVYDAIIIAVTAIYLFAYLRIAPSFADLTRPPDPAISSMGAFGTCAFLLLTLTLSIGPLARLDRRFLPLLYNRRHLGVLTCAIALVHASHVLGWYFSFSPTGPYEALLSANTSYGRIVGFPFETLGILALVVLLVLALTSHDFWLAFLTPPVWKAIHMGVYLAYGLAVMHVALGALQAATDPLLATVVTAGAVTVCGLHLAAARAGRRDGIAAATADDGWIAVGDVAAIADGRAVTVDLPGGERAAVFRNGECLSALANECAHQNGPLGEGLVIDGCATCPWHGFQYRLEDGCAPAPYSEKLATFRLRLEGTRVLLDPRANPPGTRVEPLRIGPPRTGEA